MESFSSSVNMVSNLTLHSLWKEFRETPNFSDFKFVRLPVAVLTDKPTSGV
jgi:hypothetical protein